MSCLVERCLVARQMNSIDNTSSPDPSLEWPRHLTLTLVLAGGSRVRRDFPAAHAGPHR